MSYCRFENTSRDLHDCSKTIDEIVNTDNAEPLSETELEGALRLVTECVNILTSLSEFAGIDTDWLQENHPALMDAMEEASKFHI